MTVGKTRKSGKSEDEGVMMYEVDGDEMAEYAARRDASEHWLAEFRRPYFGVDQ